MYSSTYSLRVMVEGLIVSRVELRLARMLAWLVPTELCYFRYIGASRTARNSTHNGGTSAVQCVSGLDLGDMSYVTLDCITKGKGITDVL